MQISSPAIMRMSITIIMTETVAATTMTETVGATTGEELLEVEEESATTTLTGSEKLPAPALVTA